MKFLKQLQYKMAVFMQGRYGIDNFEKFLLVLYFVVWLLSYFFVWLKPLYFILEIVSLAVIIFIIFRFFSKNLSARQKENIIYLKYKTRFMNFVRVKKSRMQRRKEHHLFKCPNCGQIVSVPKGKGKIKIICPKCAKEFVRRSWLLYIRRKDVWLYPDR